MLVAAAPTHNRQDAVVSDVLAERPVSAADQTDDIQPVDVESFVDLLLGSSGPKIYIIHAPAGTGKTHLSSLLIAKYISNSNHSEKPGKVLAMSFTKAATARMLEVLRSQPELNLDEASLAIRTIHSFAAQVLNSRIFKFSSGAKYLIKEPDNEEEEDSFIKLATVFFEKLIDGYGMYKSMLVSYNHLSNIEHFDINLFQKNLDKMANTLLAGRDDKEIKSFVDKMSSCLEGIKKDIPEITYGLLPLLSSLILTVEFNRDKTTDVYDLIVIDEAQDTNVTLLCLLRPLISKATRVVMLLDRSQDIYQSLTDASLTSLGAVKEYRLTYTRRFAPSYAKLISSLYTFLTPNSTSRESSFIEVQQMRVYKINNVENYVPKNNGINDSAARLFDKDNCNSLGLLFQTNLNAFEYYMHCIYLMNKGELRYNVHWSPKGKTALLFEKAYYLCRLISGNYQADDFISGLKYALGEKLDNALVSELYTYGNLFMSHGNEINADEFENSFLNGGLDNTLYPNVHNQSNRIRDFINSIINARKKLQTDCQGIKNIDDVLKLIGLDTTKSDYAKLLSYYTANIISYQMSSQKQQFKTYRDIFNIVDNMLLLILGGKVTPNDVDEEHSKTCYIRTWYSCKGEEYDYAICCNADGFNKPDKNIGKARILYVILTRVRNGCVFISQSALELNKIRDYIDIVNSENASACIVKQDQSGSKDKNMVAALFRGFVTPNGYNKPRYQGRGSNYLGGGFRNTI